MAWRSCSVLLRLTREEVSRSSLRGGSRWPPSFQQRCGFKKAARKPETKKVEEDLGLTHSEPSEAVGHRRTSPRDLDQQALSSSPRAFSRLVKPFVFTVGFTGCSFGSAAIWQYESLKSKVQSYFNELRDNWLEKVRPQKRLDLRKEINIFWNCLSEGQRTISGIIFANFIVFCCWRAPSLQRVMIKYFTSNPAYKALCAPMLPSTFSHFSLFHLAANMYVLWSFSSTAVSMLGREQFIAVYLSGGVISTFVSYVAKMATGRFCPSLGASGAIMAVIATICTKMPETKMAIIFLPMYTFSAASALKAVMALDAAGLVLGWRFFDHAAHLGGALFGIWYILYGHELIWKNREPFVKFWHELRTRGGGGPGPGGGEGGGGGVV